MKGGFMVRMGVVKNDCVKCPMFSSVINFEICLTCIYRMSAHSYGETRWVYCTYDKDKPIIDINQELKRKTYLTCRFTYCLTNNNRWFLCRKERCEFFRPFWFLKRWLSRRKGKCIYNSQELWTKVTKDEAKEFLIKE